MRLVLYGLLREKYGESITIGSANTIADAIEGASTQLPDWPRDLPISVVGYNDQAEIMTQKPDEVHLMPTLQGGSSKIINFIVGAALVVVGTVLVLFGGPVGAAIGVSLIASGAVMILNGIIMLFMKSPKLDKDDDPEASKYFGLNRNTTANRTPMNMAYGRIKVFPHWLSLQADSSLMMHGAFPVTPT